MDTIVAFYKYLKKEHLQQFRKEYTVAIGNIELYRKTETKEINDPFEGRTVYYITDKQDPIDLSVEQVNAITNDYYFRASLRISPNTFFKPSLKVPNAFSFSMSCRFDKNLMKSFGYDAYYKITDIKQFIAVLYDDLGKQHQLLFSVADKVRYVKTKMITITNANKDTVIRTTPYDKSKSDRIKTIYIEDYFTKPELFKEEEEFRLIFVPATPISKELVFLHDRRLLNYCEF